MARGQRRIIPPMPEGGYRAIRLWARSWMQSYPVIGVDVDDVQLVLTELVSNAIRHGSGPVDVELVADASRLRLNVSDGSDVMPHQSTISGNARGGRGLILIGRLTTGWTAEPRPGGGKTVWCEFHSPTAPHSRQRR